MKIIFASNIFSQPWFILVLLIAFFGIIALLVFILRAKFKINKVEKPKDDKQVAKENLSHYLQDVDDPETQKEFDEYAKKEQEENKDGSTNKGDEKKNK
jgi:cytoskeletal protein RodZ